MKTSAKQFTSYGNIALVQLKAEPETTFAFNPGGPELRSGGLVITEANESGVVGRLVALNNTGSFLLLTDADVLVGAKQNRILNKSMLLAPNSKTIIDVSCIERLRWQYNARNFTSPDSAADPGLRKTKASSMSFLENTAGQSQGDTQGAVWSHINFTLRSEGFSDKTESYHELISHRKVIRSGQLPKIRPEKACNGMAVLSGGKVQCIDLFGTKEVYRYYFPLLRDSALLMAGAESRQKPVDIHEAYFRVLDTLDSLETATRRNEASYSGAGILNLAENTNHLGFELLMDGQLIHQAVFGK